MASIMSKNTRLQAASGFTLIELLVVIAIVGLLASVVLIATNAARLSSRDTKRKADVAQFQKALELYYNDNGQYPPSGGAIAPNAGWSTSNDASWATLQTILAKYISKLPVEPKQTPSDGTGAAWSGNNLYTYSYYSMGYGCGQQWYMLIYNLEKTDGVGDAGIKPCDSSSIIGTWPDGRFHYGGLGSPTTIKTVGVSGQ